MIQPNSTATMAAIERKPLEGITLKLVGAIGTATLRNRSVKFVQMHPQLLKQLPIPLAEIDIFLGSFDKSHRIAKSIFFTFHISDLQAFPQKVSQV